MRFPQANLILSLEEIFQNSELARAHKRLVCGLPTGGHRNAVTIRASGMVTVEG